jgi:hypothetical protein
MSQVQRRNFLVTAGKTLGFTIPQTKLRRAEQAIE